MSKKMRLSFVYFTWAVHIFISVFTQYNANITPKWRLHTDTPSHEQWLHLCALLTHAVWLQELTFAAPCIIPAEGHLHVTIENESNTTIRYRYLSYNFVLDVLMNAIVDMYHFSNNIFRFRCWSIYHTYKGTYNKMRRKHDNMHFYFRIKNL